MTSIIVRALDSFKNDEETRNGVVEKLLKYIHTDSVCYMQDYPSSFVELQKNNWIPLINWLDTCYGIKIDTTHGINPIKQSDEVVKKLRAVIDAYDIYKLAAFEKAVLRAKSFIIGLGLIEGRISVDEAVVASNLEVIQQINKA